MTTTAVDLLYKGNEGRVEPWINQYWGPLLGGSLGFTISCLANFGTRRPVLSGVQKHVAATLVCGFLGDFFEKRRRWYFAEREAVFRHYVSLHPEDFQEPAPRKIGDIVEPWIPIR